MVVPIAIVGLSLALSLSYRALVELFDTDMITSFVGTYILANVSILILIAISLVSTIFIFGFLIRGLSPYK
ncbi:MAG: hypothetical protein QXM75_03720 [Candidatus Diapherotrites archaeon]